MSTERSRFAIIKDILNVIRDENNQTIQETHLDSRTFQTYLDFLLAESFIAKCNSDSEFYKLTEIGENFLEGLKVVEIPTKVSEQFQYQTQQHLQPAIQFL